MPTLGWWKEGSLREAPQTLTPTVRNGGCWDDCEDGYCGSLHVIAPFPSFAPVRKIAWKNSPQILRKEKTACLPFHHPDKFETTKAYQTSHAQGFSSLPLPTLFLPTCQQQKRSKKASGAKCLITNLAGKMCSRGVTLWSFHHQGFGMGRASAGIHQVESWQFQCFPL